MNLILLIIKAMCYFPELGESPSMRKLFLIVVPGLLGANPNESQIHDIS